MATLLPQMSSLRVLLPVLCSFLLSADLAAQHKDILPGVKRIVFLGDSITYAGQYVEFIDAWLVTRFSDRQFELLDLGLPSETVSGLSEPGHAGGKFPRPDLHERLERVLLKTKPDLVVACYGMNDGIYYPFGEERFQKYQEGMRRLRERAAAAGAKVLHVTPPTFDPVPIKAKTLPIGQPEYRQPYEGYNEVLDRYSAWLLAERAQRWEVVDAHGPMNRHLAEQRAKDPGYFLAGDGVHANATGHWLIAREIILHLGGGEDVRQAADASALLSIHPQGVEILKLVQQRQRVLKDAWLTDTGHLRPGMKQGLPLAEAQKQTREISEKISVLAGTAAPKRD
jgi:lysophospholipase L1-like esterase